ncbi:DUF6304 family protein [Dokdonia ponticola]|uniref:DUF6304 family protein n=1 Tax=Dokdonia ponticola TaxID=2041041 RepID=A0ABV9I066_9FLAO
MTNLKTYKGFFENNLGISEIEIENDFEYLKFDLDTFKFEGTSFDDFELLNYDNYSKTELERFLLNKISCGQGFVYELCDCNINIFIPILIKDIVTKETFERKLDIKIEIGKSLSNGVIDRIEVSLSLKIFNDVLTVKNGNFEGALTQIQKKIEPRFKLNNCFGCNFSDYSPYGNSLFGDMLCFKNQKEDYLKVKNKKQFFNLNKPDRIVQETYCCEEFELRGENIGYRG